jgi:hypothetical protein
MQKIASHKASNSPNIIAHHIAFCRMFRQDVLGDFANDHPIYWKKRNRSTAKLLYLAIVYTSTYLKSQKKVKTLISNY